MMPNLRGNRMSNIHPDELYEQLCENATSRKKKTLTLVHEVCKKQSESDVKDFSLCTIAGLMAEKGGLSEQALRNKNAEPYRLLISRWAEYSNTTTKKPKKQTSTTINDEILSQISEPTTKALVGMIMAENRKLKNENNMLKNQTCITIDMRNPPNTTSTSTDVVVVSALDDLTETEIEALKEAISEKFFKKRGWTTDDYGRVKEEGYTVYKAGYVTAIKKILEEI